MFARLSLNEIVGKHKHPRRGVARIVSQAKMYDIMIIILYKSMLLHCKTANKPKYSPKIEQLLSVDTEVLSSF